MLQPRPHPDQHPCPRASRQQRRIGCLSSCGCPLPLAMHHCLLLIPTTIAGKAEYAAWVGEGAAAAWPLLRRRFYHCCRPCYYYYLVALRGPPHHHRCGEKKQVCGVKTRMLLLGRRMKEAREDS